MRTFLVRHGDYESGPNGGKLIDIGVAQSIDAGNELAGEELGDSIYIISSCSGRAVQTANHIAKVLNIAEVVPCAEITINHPDRDRTTEVNSLLCAVLRRHDVPCNQIDTIIAVTHEPVIEEALQQMGLSESGHAIPPGSITEYLRYGKV